MERGTGKASLLQREKGLEERARAKRWGLLQTRESRTEGWRQREREGEGDSQTAEDEGRELGSQARPRNTCESKGQL